MMQTLRMHSAPPSYHHSLSLTSNNTTLDSPTSSEYTVAHSFFSETPLTALSASTRRQLSQLLNSKKVLRSEEGYERDWRGIAALSKQKFLCDENAISGDDPIAKVLTLWCANNPQSATFANLENYLGIIDRWDVSDDITENLVRDSEVYKSKQQLQSHTSASDDTDNASQANGNGNAYQTDFAHGSDPNILTEDDVIRAQKGLPPQQYDAFVLFADEDINYAVELITRLEEESAYNFKLCLKERDCLGGISFPHVKLSQLIEDRCKHLIVILTQEFLKSPENTFLVDYTQSNQIKYNTRKIIPLIYDSTVAIPKTLQIYTHLKYSSQTTGLVNFWAKLASSISNVNHHHIEPAPTTTHYATHKERYSSSSKQLSIASTNSNSTANAQPLTIDLSQLPTPPADIPSININGHAFTPEDEHDGVAVGVEDADESKKSGKSERRLFKKRSSLRQANDNPVKLEAPAMRNAVSTSQLNSGGKYVSNNNSMSDLSNASICSDSKKKKKWPFKVFKKVFSRSTTKLQESTANFY